MIRQKKTSGRWAAKLEGIPARRPIKDSNGNPKPCPSTKKRKERKKGLLFVRCFFSLLNQACEMPMLGGEGCAEVGFNRLSGEMFGRLVKANERREKNGE